jgi:hypothetical protein
MDIPTLVMAYGAAAMVALTVTAAFSAPIEEVLFRLLPSEVAPAWQQFVKFGLFVITFGGGMPIIARGAPPATPVPGENFMIVMSSLSGGLMAAAWALLLFFAITLAALAGLRFYTMMRRRREAEESAKRDKERKEEPSKRREPTESRRW